MRLIRNVYVTRRSGWYSDQYSVDKPAGQYIVLKKFTEVRILRMEDGLVTLIERNVPSPVRFTVSMDMAEQIVNKKDIFLWALSK